MSKYSFEILSPEEFEDLTRDLVGVKMGLYFESFKNGPDGGIDFRCSEVKGGDIILQSKRYMDYKNLHKELKKEVKKVDKLNKSHNLKRYILATSVDLSKDQKNEIFQLFTPYIKYKADIFGRKDLNKLLAKNPDIEENYHQLWLSSTTVLNTILHKARKCWSEAEVLKIQRAIEVYAPNESYVRALKILNKYHILIISDIPGIGKTTLARMLIAQKLTEGYNELVRVRSDIDEAAEMWQKGKKQIFFYDDFLGETKLEDTRLGREGKKLIDFIDLICEDGDKLFIMTTREYILQHAKESNETFGANANKYRNCIIGIEDYPSDVRKRILENHVRVACLPKSLENRLWKDKNYEKITEHENFSPRVIERYLDDGEWNNYPASAFLSTFIAWLDNPIKVWDYAFANLEEREQHALLVFETMYDGISESVWREAFNTYCEMNAEKLHISCSYTEWKRMMKKLDGTFIQLEKNANGVTYVDSYNPSIRDYLFHYIKENGDVQSLLLAGARYLEQLFTIFSNRVDLVTFFAEYMLITPEQYKIVRRRFVELMQNDVPSNMWDVKIDGASNPVKKIEMLTILNVSYENDGLLEQVLTKDDLLATIIPAEDRLSMLSEIDYSKVDYTFDEIIEAIAQERLEVNGYDALFNLLILKKKKGVVNRDLVQRLKQQVMAEIVNPQNVQLRLPVLAQAIRSIGEKFSKETFPKDLYIALARKALQEELDRLPKERHYFGDDASLIIRNEIENYAERE